jgi:hypothetical protein
MIITSTRDSTSIVQLIQHLAKDSSDRPISNLHWEPRFCTRNLFSSVCAVECNDSVQKHCPDFSNYFLQPILFLVQNRCREFWMQHPTIQIRDKLLAGLDKDCNVRIFTRPAEHGQGKTYIKMRKYSYKRTIGPVNWLLNVQKFVTRYTDVYSVTWDTISDE